MAVTTLERFKFRKIRVRNKVIGTSERPRLSVYRSLKNIMRRLLLIQRRALVAASLFDSKQKSKGEGRTALQVGRLCGVAVKKNIKRAVFDRGGSIMAV